jgi:hypothetical protein
MRATIIIPDNLMSVDGGKFRNVDCASLAGENQRAVRWYDTYGEVEFTRGYDHERKIPTCPPNQYITDFSMYQSYVDAYGVEDARQTLIEEEILRKIEADKAQAALVAEQAKSIRDQWDAEVKRLGGKPPSPDWRPKLLQNT